MALTNEDLLLISRGGADFKTKYSTLLQSLNLDLDKLSEAEVIEIINNILAGKNPDGTEPLDPKKYLKTGDDVSELLNDAGYLKNGDDVSELLNDAGYIKTGDGVSELLNDAGYIDTPAGDGTVTIAGGVGITVGGTLTHNVDQTVDTTSQIKLKYDTSGAGGINVDANGNIIVDPDWFDQNETTANDGAINLIGGSGVSVTGDSISANQSGASATTFNVDLADTSLTFDNNKLKVNKDWLDLNSPAPNDIDINLVGSNGIEVTGDTPSTDQSNESTTTFGLKLKSGGDIVIDADGDLAINGGYIPVMKLNDLTDVTATNTDQYILTYDANFDSGNGGWVAAYNPIADTPVQFKRPIDVSLPAPVGPHTAGDLYVHHKDGVDSVTAETSWTGIAGETVQEGQYVLYGSDNQWHLGRTNDSLENVQSNWGETDVNQLSYIQNKPDIEAIVDSQAGDGEINVEAGQGLAAEGSNATANQSTTTTRTLKAVLGDGLTFDANDKIAIDPAYNLDGNVTLPSVGDGEIKFQSGLGVTVGGDDTAKANQTTSTTTTFAVKAGDGIGVDDSGVHIDTNWLNVNSPAPNNGTITIKQEGVTPDQTFTVNQAGDTEINLVDTVVDAYTKAETDTMFGNYIAKNSGIPAMPFLP